MIKLIPFDFAHFDIFEPSPADVARYGEISSKMDNPLAEYGNSFTAIADGRVIAFGGILAQTAHTGYGWTMLGVRIKDYGMEPCRMTRRLLNQMMDDMQLHRIETANLAEATEHHKWCKVLGFVEEGPMLQYDDQKRDYIRFAKVKGS